MKFSVLFAAGILAACSASCGGGESPAGSGKLQVVATTGMIADVARNIGGEYVEVFGIIGEGVDPHLYKPTSNDVKKFQSADVVFYNGLKLEGKMGDVLEKTARGGKRVVAVADTEQGEPAPDSSGHVDPHVWMDPTIWSEAGHKMMAALADAAPEHRNVFEANLLHYDAKLLELDSYAEEAVATIPEDRRVLVTAHDAFNYFARAYGLEVRGIQGISTESEAGVKDIEDLVDYLVEKKIPAVFVETSVSDKNVRALIEGAAAKGHPVEIGGSLFSDAMGGEGTYEGTYIGMVDSNVTTIVRALGGEAPERGFQGKLSPQKN